MGAAAERRYRVFAARQATEGQKTMDQLFIADLNAIPKLAGAPVPWGEIVFVCSHGGWWAECPTTGYGYWYRTLRVAVSSWAVAIFNDNGRLIGLPLK